MTARLDGRSAKPALRLPQRASRLSAQDSSGGRPPRGRVEENRELIFAAAMAEFSEKGFRGATIASIAERSGVSRVTVYKHAESKEQLLRRLSEFSSEQFRASLERAIDERLPCWEVLMRVGRCVYSDGQHAHSRAISRVLIIEAERLPDIASIGLDLREWALEPLTRYLGKLSMQGDLMIDNPQFSAQQFLNLTTGSVDYLFRNAALSDGELDIYLAAAVKTFLYGVSLRRGNSGTQGAA